jgi:MFS superfamily sulfate permease-like transporter
MRFAEPHFVGGRDERWLVLQSLDAYPFLARDLVAGVTLAAIAIPEQMATARLGGFPRERIVRLTA